MSTGVIPQVIEDDEFSEYLHSRLWHLLEASALRIPPNSILFKLYYLTISFFYVYHIGLLIYTMAQISDDIDTCILNFFYVVLLGMCTNVLWNIAYGRNALNYIFWGLRSIRPFEYTDPEFDEKRKGVVNKVNRRLIIAVPVYVVITLVIVMARPSIDYFQGNHFDVVNGVNKNLPVPLWNPYDSGSSALLFACALFSQVITGSMVAVVIVAIFYTNANATIEMIDLLHRTRHSMVDMNSRVAHKLRKKGISAPMFGAEWQDACYECICETTQVHQTLCRIMFAYNILAGNVLVTLFGSATIIMAMTLYQLTNPEVEFIIKAQFCIMGFAELFIFGFICAVGQKLTDVSEELHEDLFHCTWQDWNQKSKLALNIMQTRTTLEYKLVARFIKVPANIDTFASLLNSAYSYVNLLLAFQEEQ